MESLYTEPKKSNNKVVNALLTVVVVLVVLAMDAALQYGISTWFLKTNHLGAYFLEVLYRDTLGGVLVTFFIVVGVWFLLKIEGTEMNLKRIVLFFWVIAAVYMMIINLLPVTKRYEEVLIADQTPSKLTYKYNILLDWAEQETITTELSVEQLETDSNHYTYKSGRSTRSTNSYYIYFQAEDNQQYASLEYQSTTRYLDALMELEDTVQIEYYPHSGIIKSIDGIEKNNEDTLYERIVSLEEEKRLQQEAAVRAEQEQQEQLRQQNEQIRNIMENAVGMEISKLLRQFEEQELPFTREIKYISSQMYPVDTIAFYDTDAVFVVEDAEEEDMIPIPYVELGMTREEVIEVLEEAGFGYECDDFSCEMHETNTLHTFHFRVGTLVPKGYVVWFSVDK